MKLTWCLILLAVCTCLTSGTVFHRLGSSGTKLNNNECGGVTCRAGRECRMTAAGVATCECMRSCPRGAQRHHREVCASNGRSYRSHCELHREACLRGDHTLRAVGKSRCPDKPVACLQAERDALLSRAAPVLARDATESAPVCRSASLDAVQLLQCLEEAGVLVPTVATAQHKLAQSLCVEALMEAGDQDGDWQLSRAELDAMLHHNYKPPVSNCSLEGKIYKDGAHTTVDCNTCLCACGRWVCSSAVCDHSLDFEDLEMEMQRKRAPKKVRGGAQPKKVARLRLIKAKEWENE